MNKTDLIGYLDFTTLNNSDTQNTITALCQKALTPEGNVAAVCVYGQFVSLAKSLLKDSHILVATVANFPQGTQSISDTVKEIEAELKAGADEIDVVIDYHAFLAGNKRSIYDLVNTCKSVCVDRSLKVILETGELKQAALIDYASKAALEAGANFLKTSTGKVEVNATLEAADIMLQAIASTNPKAGFKAAGGIKLPEQAFAYFDLAEKHLGSTWITPTHMRIGASSLLDNILLK